MKCKMFLVGTLEDGEKEVNKWLKTKPYIYINQVSTEAYNSKYEILLIVFYSDRKDKLNNLNLLRDQSNQIDG